MLRHSARPGRHVAEARRGPAARPAPGLSLGTPAAVLAAQRRYGNRTVGRVLTRQATAVRPQKAPLRTAREIDAIFDTSPFLRRVAGGKLGKSIVEKAMKLDSDASFESAWIAYAKRSHNPDTGQNYTEEEARKYLATQGVRAFQDEERGEIHVQRTRADLGTQLHEGLHLICDDKWRRRMDYAVNEGVTEFFTRKVGKEVGVERGDESFLRQYTSVTHLVAAAGEDAVAAAYFRGELAALKAKIDGKKAGGKGTWDRWLAHLAANDFKGANALMKSLL